jgi:mRNA interferase MazF
MRYQKYDIVLTHFPFSHLKKIKKRPAIIIRELEGENNILSQVSTKSRNFDKYTINLRNEDCEGEIRLDSFIHVNIMATLHESIIIRKIGRLTNDTIKNQINNKLKLLFN